MNGMKQTIICSCLLLALLPNWAIAQQKVQEVTEITYTLVPNDSIVKEHKKMNYDQAGRLLNKKNYYYNNSKLIKEETASFDTQKQVLTELEVVYSDNKDPRSEKIETKYLVYAAPSGESKHIWQLQYNDYADIVKEDTITYNAQLQPTEHCVYDYRGTTSLRCDEWEYNKKNQLCNNRYYSKWTTINGRGQVTEKKSKKRDYKYRYTRAGQLKKEWGKSYGTKLCRRIKYNKTGEIQQDYKQRVVKIKRLVSPKKDDKTAQQSSEETDKSKKPTKKRYKTRKQKEVYILNYQDGKVIEQSQLIDGKLISKVLNTYQDTLVKTYEQYRGDKITDRISYEYDEQQLLTKTRQDRYNTSGRIVTSFVKYYNADRQVTKDEQWRQGKRYSTRSTIYDANGNPKEKTLSLLNNQNIEKTTYIYKYFD